MLKENGQDVEPLVDLAVGVDQITVIHSEDVVDTDIYIYAREAVLVLEKGHLDGWDVAKSSLFGNLLYNLPTVFDELMLVVSHPAMENNDDIDITATSCPQTIHAGASCRDGYLSLEEVALRATVPIIERILDPLNHLVSRFQVIPLDTLLLVDDFYYLLCAF